MDDDKAASTKRFSSLSSFGDNEETIVTPGMEALVKMDRYKTLKGERLSAAVRGPLEWEEWRRSVNCVELEQLSQWRLDHLLSVPQEQLTVDELAEVTELKCELGNGC